MVCPTCNFLTPDTTINENEPIGTFVGKLLTDDQCKGSCLAVHNYELVPGDGDDDNSSFSFEGFIYNLLRFLIMKQKSLILLG